LVSSDFTIAFSSMILLAPITALILYSATLVLAEQIVFDEFLSENTEISHALVQWTDDVEVNCDIH
jgi:hypothetical protein